MLHCQWLLHREHERYTIPKNLQPYADGTFKGTPQLLLLVLIGMPSLPLHTVLIRTQE